MSNPSNKAKLVKLIVIWPITYKPKPKNQEQEFSTTPITPAMRMYARSSHQWDIQYTTIPTTGLIILPGIG